ncbi:MAG TPA: VCBS repeat-containing protein [Bacteroidia bacterium]
MKKSITILAMTFCLKANAQVCFSPASASPFTAGSAPHSVISADFNGDGKLDLAVANSSSIGTVSILLGNGTGTFGTATNFTVGSNPQSVTSAGFNGDGFADLAVANANSNNVSILLGNGTGTFGAVTNFAVGGADPWSVTSADFNGDGYLDLATANAGGSSNGNTVSVLLGTGFGTFGTATNFTVGTGPQGKENVC